MYDNDYEYDILGVLRLLRFVQMYRPERAARLVAGETRFSTEEILEFIYYSINEIFDDCYSEYDEMSGSEHMCIYDTVFDEYLDLSAKLVEAHPCSIQAVRRRFEDIVTFFLADRNCGIFDMTIRYEDNSPQIQLEFAEGYWEPGGLVIALTDLMHYLIRRYRPPVFRREEHRPAAQRERSGAFRHPALCGRQGRFARTDAQPQGQQDRDRL